MRLSFTLLFFVMTMNACSDRGELLIKPHQYPRIDFPEKTYQTFSEADCDFSFELPEYASIEQKVAYFDDAPLHPCWFDIAYEPFNGKLHCSYYPINSRAQLDMLISDAFELVSKHHIKANFREETLIKRDDVNGILFDISGPVASPAIFFLTDSLQHFFIASLYFDNQVNPDSMKVVHDFVRADVVEMIESFDWRN